MKKYLVFLFIIVWSVVILDLLFIYVESSEIRILVLMVSHFKARLAVRLLATVAIAFYTFFLLRFGRVEEEH